jgi:hypothetical protein
MTPSIVPIPTAPTDVEPIRSIYELLGSRMSDQLPTWIELAAYWMTDGEDLAASAFVEAWSNATNPGQYEDDLALILDCMDWDPPIGDTLPVQRGGYVIYRGVGDLDHPNGMSWTRDRQVAEFFAYRYRRVARPNPGVLRAIVNRNQVLAYITDRGEAEIVLTPGLSSKISKRVI